MDAGPASPLVEPGGSLAYLADWTTAFHTAGTALGTLTREGTIHRGIRAVLAHHLIFHWNRIGLPYPAQGLPAHTAKTIILGD